MAKIGELVVGLVADTSKFQSQITKAQENFSSASKTMLGIGGALSAIGAPFALIAKNAIDTADGFNKMSQKAGVSVEFLSSLSHAAELADVEMETLQKSLIKLSKNAVDGSKSFAAVGISLKDSSGHMKGADALLREIADKFASMPDGVEKSALAVKLFGKAGAEMIPLLNSGAEGIKAMQDEATKFGLTISTNAAKASEDFNDSITRLTNSLVGVAKSIIDTGLLDRLTNLINYIAELASNFAKSNPMLVEAIAIVGGLSAVLGPLLVAVGAVTAAIGAMSTPVLAVFGAAGVIAAAIVAISEFAASNESVSTFLKETWQGIKDFVSGIITALMDVFKAAAEAGKGIWSIWGSEILFIFKSSFALLAPVVTEAFKLIKTLLEAALKLITGVLQTFTGIMTGDWSKFSEGIKNIWSALWSAIKGIITAPLRAVKDSVKGFTTEITNYFAEMYDKIVGHSFVPDLIDGIGDEFGKLGRVMVDPADKATSRVVTSFRDVLTKVSAFARDWKSAMKDMALSIVDSLGGIKGAFDAIKNMDFEAIGKAIKGALGIGGTVGRVGGSVGSTVGSGAGSAVGSAVGGSVSGVVGAVSGVVSAVSGIIGNFQMARLEGTMNAVEYNTRASEIHLRLMLGEYLVPFLPHIPYIRENQREQINQLDAIFNVLNRPVSNTKAAVVSSASTVAPVVNVSLQLNIENHQEFDDEISRRTVRDVIWPEILEAAKNGIGLEELTRMIKNAMQGVVTTA